MVVDDVCHVVRWHPVRLDEDLVIDSLSVEGDIAANHIFKTNGFVAWHLEANNVLGAISKKLLDLIVRQRQRVAHLRPRGGIVLG